jgi:hypothetical protein
MRRFAAPGPDRGHAKRPLAQGNAQPAGVKTATRKSRQIIAIGCIILGVFMIALFTAQIPSE